MHTSFSGLGNSDMDLETHSVKSVKMGHQVAMIIAPCEFYILLPGDTWTIQNNSPGIIRKEMPNHCANAFYWLSQRVSGVRYIYPY